MKATEKLEILYQRLQRSEESLESAKKRGIKEGIEYFPKVIKRIKKAIDKLETER